MTVLFILKSEKVINLIREKSDRSESLLEHRD